MRRSSTTAKRDSLIKETRFEIERELDAVLVAHTHTIPAADASHSGGDREVILVLSPDSMRIRELRAGQVITIADWSFPRFKTIIWDHQHAQVQLTMHADVDAAEPDADADAGAMVTLSVPKCVELEHELAGRLEACRLEFRRPAVSYIGMFAGAQKPKPFQRRRASLTAAAANSGGMRIAPTTMRRLSLQTAHELPSGTRRELALQHIHSGANRFTVSAEVRNARGGDTDGDGEGGAAPPASASGIAAVLVLSYEGARLNNADTDKPPIVEWAHAAVAQWAISGNASTVAAAAANPPSSAEAAGDGPAGTVTVWLADGKSIVMSLTSATTGSAANGSSSSVHLAHAIEFFVNNSLLVRGLGPVPGTTHGRAVVSVHTLRGEMEDARDTVSARLAQAAQVKQLPEPKTGNARMVKPPHWDQYVRFHGALLKKGGLRKRWERRFAILFQTTQGHFLAYYSSMLESPPYAAKGKEKERNLIDLSTVTMLRPALVEAEQKGKDSTAPPFGFELVTLERVWAFCAESEEQKQVWLQLLSRVVDEDVAIVPDDDISFAVKAVCDPTGKLSTTDYSTTLVIRSQGVLLTTKPKGSDCPEEVIFWCYTDIQKWSLAMQKGKPCLQMVCFTSDDFRYTEDFVFRTTDSGRLSETLEFYIEKFMSVMQLQSDFSVPNVWQVPPASVAAAGAAEVDTFAGTEAPVLSAAEVAALDSDEDDDDEDEGALPPAPPGHAGASTPGAATFSSLLQSS